MRRTGKLAPHRGFGFALAGVLSLACAACQTTLQGTPRADATLPAASKVAFEGFVGVPREAGDEVITALVSAGNERRFALVAAGDPTAAYVMRGYLAPQPEGGTTAFNFVWDLFDRAGNRIQRLAGETHLPAAARDGWSLVQGSGARAIAEASATEISRFLAAAALPVAQVNLNTAEGASTAASGALATPVVEQSPAPPAALPVAGEQKPAKVVKRKTIELQAVSGLEEGLAQRLRAAAEKALGEAGYQIAPQGSSSDVRLSAEATVNPSFAGRRLTAVVWRVADSHGKELGEVRQFAQLGNNGVEAPAALSKAIDTLLPGVVALVPPRP